MYINIPDILKKGEGISVEFKRAKNKLPENLFDTVCAFLNRNGGTVLLGVLDNDRYDDRENIRCNLVQAYDRLMAFVVKHLPDKFYLQGDQRISLREKIFREIVANMLIHREYANAYPSSFTIYRNRVEIKNANKPHLWGFLTPDNFEPFPKNPHIAQIFTQMGRSEELGTGIRNVFKYTHLYSGSDKITFNEEDIFITTVPIDEEVLYSNIDEVVGSIETEKIGEQITKNQNKTVDKTVDKIVSLIKENPQITQVQLAELTGLSMRGVEWNLSNLKANGLLKRIDGKKYGYWKIIEKQ